MRSVKVLRSLAWLGCVVGSSGALAAPPGRAAVPAEVARAGVAVAGAASPEAPSNPYVPPACAGIFSDVACPSGFAVKWIEQFYNDGITAGCGTNPLTYCPDATVTRAQMAVFVEKAMRGTSAWSPGDLGSGNTGLGSGALLNNSPYAADNTAVGTAALHVQSFDFGSVLYGSYNTAIGFYALYSNQPDGVGDDGTSNSAVGAQSLQSNTTGYENTALGVSTLANNQSGFQNTALGSYALNQNHNGFQNTAVGRAAMVATDGGFANTAVGFESLLSNSTGSGNTAVGSAADVASGSLTNATAIGYAAVVDATNHVRIGNTNVTQIGGQVGWSNLSDMRAKSDIRDLDLGLDFVLALRPVSYRMKGGNGRTDMGFVAQDIEALLGDEYNVLGIGGDKDRTLSLRYTDFIAPMVKAIQEQQATIEAQQKQLDAKDAQIADLEKASVAQQARVATQQSQVEVLLARVAKLEAAIPRQ